MLCACGRLESLYDESGSRVRESRRVYPGGGAIDAAESHQWIAGRGSPRHDHYHVGHAARRYRQPRGAEQRQASTGRIVRIGRGLNSPGRSSWSPFTAASASFSNSALILKQRPQLVCRCTCKLCSPCGCELFDLEIKRLSSRLSTPLIELGQKAKQRNQFPQAVRAFGRAFYSNTRMNFLKRCCRRVLANAETKRKEAAEAAAKLESEKLDRKLMRFAGLTSKAATESGLRLCRTVTISPEPGGSVGSSLHSSRIEVCISA